MGYIRYIGIGVVRVIKAVGSVGCGVGWCWMVLGCCYFDLLGWWVVCLFGPLSVSLIVGSLGSLCLLLGQSQCTQCQVWTGKQHEAVAKRSRYPVLINCEKLRSANASPCAKA